MPYLQADQLTKTFRSGNGTYLPVLSNVSINVEKGEFVSFFGPNGCGKSTLLFLIAGVEHPDSGKILLKGAAVENCRVGMVFQNYRDALLPWRSNLSNLCLPLELYNISNSERTEKGQKLAQDLGLEIDMNSYPYQLSGGQQQLLSLARALISEPDILLLDEPLSSLDFQTGFRMVDKIQAIWERMKITTVLVSHDIEDAIYLSDRIYFLTERPASIGKEMFIPLPRPRTPETRTTKDFFELKNRGIQIFTQLLRND